MRLFITSLILFAMTAARALAQNDIPVSSTNGTSFSGSLQKPPAAQSTMNTFYIDYDSAEATAYGTQYRRMMYPMNKYYTAADSAANYFIVAFDSLYDSYNSTGYPLDSVTSLGIDSLFLFLGQENNSGTDDTVVVRILPVDAFGYPMQNTQNQLWWTVIVLPSFNPLSADWRQPVMIPLFPNLIDSTINRFCVKVEYWGNPLDTLGFVAGYGDLDSCGTLPTSAALTQFSTYNLTTSNTFNANSFVLYSQYSTFGPLPTQSGSHLYYDCDGSMNYTPGTDGESLIQNIALIAKVTTNDVLSVSEPGASPVTTVQIFPNPCTEKTTVSYVLSAPANVVITVSDITGKAVIRLEQAGKTSGKNSSELETGLLEAGAYFFTVSANGSTTTGKFTVVK